MTQMPIEPRRPARGRGAARRRGPGCAAVLLFAFLAALPGSALDLLYTASLNGNLDDVEAWTAARADRLRSLPERGEALLVDAGDALGGVPDPERSSRILEAFASLGYDAVAVGDQELLAGADALTGWRDRFRLISQNLAFCTPHHCLVFSGAPLLVERAGQKVGLFSLLDPKTLTGHPKAVTEAAKLVPPEITARSLVRQLTAQGADWIVVLYHGSVRDAENLARQAPGIHAIVVGHEQQRVAPRKAGGALIVSPGQGGRRVGVLTLSRDRRGRIRFEHRFEAED